MLSVTSALMVKKKPWPAGFKILKGFVVCSIVSLVACGGGSLDEATPVTKTRSELQAQISITSPRSDASYSRLYVQGNTLYATVLDEGVQVIDNSDSFHPKGQAFINLPGVEDVLIEGDSFVTNQYSDLVIFSISQQKEISRVENLYDYKDYIELPDNSKWVDGGSVLQNQVVVGYELEGKEHDSCFIFCW